MKEQEQTVAVVVRMEHNPDNDELFLVFQVIDEEFKKRMKKDWMQDVELQLIGKELVIKE
jgi:hypothetical protein